MSYKVDPERIEIITPEERAEKLGEEFSGNKGLIALLSNPEKIKGLFNLEPSQARNVKALIAGAGTAASMRYLGKTFGDELAAIMGAAASAYLARKIFGR